jgi:hypothetical protein
MAINRDHRFPVEFNEAFPRGLVMIGEVSPDNEYQSREDKSAGRPVQQRIDEVTGKRQWVCTVADPDEIKVKWTSFEIILLADAQPVPTTSEVLPGMRPIELDGLTAQPKIAGRGELTYQSYVFRATGFKAAASGGGRVSGAKANGLASERQSKAA